MSDGLHASHLHPAELTRQADELRTMTRLHELADRLLSISDLPTGLGEVLDAAMEVFRSDRGTVQILDPEKDVLRYGASRGFDETMLADIPPIDRDFHSTCAVCIRHGERVVATDIAADPRWVDHASTAAALGYGAAFSAPMKTRKDELLGVLTVHFGKPYTLSDLELRWLDLFARMAAHLVERARVEAALRSTEERLKRDLDNFKQLQAISTLFIDAKNDKDLHERVLDAAVAIMRADFASLQVLDTNTRELHLLSCRNFHPLSAEHWRKVSIESGSMCDHALRAGERKIVADVFAPGVELSAATIHHFTLSGIAAVQSMPLITRGGRMVGMISTHWRVPHMPDDVDLRALDLLARQTADAFERADAEAALRGLADRQQVLVHELQHRTRNLLGVVRSVANRTLEGASSLDEFSQNFRERLGALARVNALLSRLTEGDRITFDELIRAELSGHGIADGNGREGQVRLTGPENVRLRSSTVQTLALGLHELTTNAIKYGALSKPEGQLSIRWSVQSGAGEQRLKVDWEETGVSPELDADGDTRRKGYGRELIEQALPYQLKAETTYKLTPDGVRCTISLPISTQA